MNNESSRPTFAEMGLVSLSTLAAMIDRDKETLRKDCRKGRIRATKSGREWRVSRAVAEQIVREGVPSRDAGG